MPEFDFVYLLLVFLAASGLTYGLSWLAFRPRSVEQRLKRVGGEVGAALAERERWQAKVAKLVGPIAKLSLPEEGWDSSALRLRFLNAGWRHPSATVLYFAAKTSLAIALPTLFMLFASTRGPLTSFNHLLLFVLLFAAFGYYLPNAWLARRIRLRQRELFEAFPDATDLIIICIEAGLGLDAAIARAGEEMRLRSSECADELQLVSMELRVGAGRNLALRNLAQRTGLDEVASLVAMLVQADRFGTSIAESLRVHADTLRTVRRLRAEEEAAKLPLKLLFPLVFFIFPALLFVLAGPAAISIYRVLLPAMTP